MNTVCKELTVYLLDAVLGGATFPAGAHEAGVLPEARLLQLGQAVVAVDVHLALCRNPSQTHTHSITHSRQQCMALIDM